MSRTKYTNTPPQGQWGDMDSSMTLQSGTTTTLSLLLGSLNANLERGLVSMSACCAEAGTCWIRSLFATILTNKMYIQLNVFSASVQHKILTQ